MLHNNFCSGCYAVIIVLVFEVLGFLRWEGRGGAGSGGEAILKTINFKLDSLFGICEIKRD